MAIDYLLVLECYTWDTLARPLKHEEKTVNSSIRKYIDELENKITFKIKTGCYVEILTS